MKTNTVNSTNALRGLLSGLLLLAAGTFNAQAATVLSAGTVLQNTQGNFDANHNIINGINQSGLSTGYTSGVTDYVSYITGNPTHTTFNSGVDHWLAGFGSGTLDFDLGGIYSLGHLALWNWNTAAGGVGIHTMQVFTSVDAAFTSPVAVDSFTFSISNDLVQAKNFTTPITTQYVRLVIANTGGGRVGFSELAFGAVPEPSRALLLLGGLMGVAMRRRRRE